MTSWPLYVFYMVLMALPLAFFFVSKPRYEKPAAPPTAAVPSKAKPAFKHSAKHNARWRTAQPSGSLTTPVRAPSGRLDLSN